MRVAFCIDNMNVGGTELNAVRTARCLVARGVALRVFSLAAEGPLLGEYAALGVPVTALPLRRLYGAGAVRAGRELMRVVRRERIGIVHAHDFYSNIFAGPWARTAGARFIASRRWWEGPERKAQRWANRASYVLADRVLANSPAVASLLHEAEHVGQGRVAVVPNFLDAAAFTDPGGAWRAAGKQELGIPADALVAGSVGSLSPIKDNALLVRAVAALRSEFPNLQLVLAGRDAGSRADLERLAATLEMSDRIRFAGERPQHPSAHYLFDVSALTSISEGLPNTVLEAMAAARPVIATRVGAVPDAVAHGTTGFIIPPRDPDALAGALRTLLGNPGLRRELGEAGRRRARDLYSEQVAIGALLALYDSVLSVARRREL